MEDCNRKGRRDIQRRIEEEFGEPLVDVVAGFAEMGYSRRDTLAILGLYPSNAGRFLRRLDPDGRISWPGPNASRKRLDIRDRAEAGRRQAKRARARAAERGELIQVRGVKETLSHWAWAIGRRHGVSYQLARKRIIGGWRPYLALTAPPGRTDEYLPPDHWGGAPASWGPMYPHRLPDRHFCQAFFNNVEALPCLE